MTYPDHDAALAPSPYAADAAGWDTAYEWRALLLLSLGFGLVGMDRYMIMSMFPTIMVDLKLGYGDLGVITGALGVAWGIAALFLGNMSDRIGRRKVLIGSLIAFSLLVGASGLSAGLASLVLIRLLMGFADGAYTPTSISATMEAARPSRHGFAVGFQQMMLPLFGLALAPLLVTQLLKVVEWRWIFLLLTLPGLLVAVLMARTIRNQPTISDAALTVFGNTLWRDCRRVLSYRNPPLLIVGMLSWLTCLITTSALLPSYLTAHLGLSTIRMGFVMSAIGFGSAAGALVLPAVSDRIGRKPVMIGSACAALFFLVLLARTGADPVLLFVFLFITNFFNFAMITLTVGPLSAESVSPALMATSSGLVIAFGELVGGAGAPVLAGYIAEHYGIEHILYLAMAGLSLGLTSTLLLAETAPRRAPEAPRRDERIELVP